jgi:hypothetical protein
LSNQIGGAPDIDLGYHAGENCRLAIEKVSTTKLVLLQTYASGWRQMATILTAEDVVRRIAAECAYVDERGGVGIRLEPAAAIVRQHGEQFRRRPRRRQTRQAPKPPSLL